MVRRNVVALTALLFFIAVASGADAAEPAASPTTALNKVPAGAKVTSEPSGLQYVDIAVGQGQSPKPGEIAIVHYTAWLEDGKEIDSSTRPRPVDPRDPAKGTRVVPFGFKVGSGQVLPGWDQGVATMREGGTRLLFLPPQLAYGSKGAGNVVPPDARLTFRVQLLRVKPDVPATPAAAAPAAP